MFLYFGAPETLDTIYALELNLKALGGTLTSKLLTHQMTRTLA